jgi:hypothetical protein
MPIFAYCCRRFSTLASLSRDFRHYFAAFRHFAASFAFLHTLRHFAADFMLFLSLFSIFALFRFSRHSPPLRQLALMLAAS